MNSLPFPLTVSDDKEGSKSTAMEMRACPSPEGDTFTAVAVRPRFVEVNNRVSPEGGTTARSCVALRAAADRYRCTPVADATGIHYAALRAMAAVGNIIRLLRQLISSAGTLIHLHERL